MWYLIGIVIGLPSDKLTTIKLEWLTNHCLLYGESLGTIDKVNLKLSNEIENL